MRGDSIYLKHYLPSQVGNNSENKQTKQNNQSKTNQTSKTNKHQQTAWRKVWPRFDFFICFSIQQTSLQPYNSAAP